MCPLAKNTQRLQADSTRVHGPSNHTRTPNTRTSVPQHRSVLSSRSSAENQLSSGHISRPSLDSGRDFHRAKVTREEMRQPNVTHRRQGPTTQPSSFEDPNSEVATSQQSLISDCDEHSTDQLLETDNIDIGRFQRNGRGYASIHDPVLRDITRAAMTRTNILTLFVNPWPTGAERNDLIQNVWRHSCRDAKVLRARTVQCEKIVCTYLRSYLFYTMLIS